MHIQSGRIAGWYRECHHVHCRKREEVDAELVTERIRTSQAAAQHRLELQNAATAAAAAEKKAAAAAQRAAQLQAELQVPIASALLPANPATHHDVMINVFPGCLEVPVLLAAEAGKHEAVPAGVCACGSPACLLHLHASR